MEIRIVSMSVDNVSQEIQITRVEINDIPDLYQIARTTFIETFADSNTKEDMQEYLETRLTEKQLRKEFEDSKSEFFIARSGSEPVGYLKVNSGTAQTELNEQESLEIERIYVSSVYHGQRVGQLLYDKALEIAILNNKTSIWLGVWEKNPRAIRFYEKNGFVAFDTHIFKMGNDEQTDVMMRKVII